MTNRLPIPGSDDGNWGDILNDFLEVSLYNNLNNGSDPNNGTLNSGVVGTSTIANNAVTNAQLDSPTQTTLAAVASKYTKPGSGIPSSDMTTAVQTNLTEAGTAFQPTTTLGGDLSGTLPSPTVAKLQGINLTSTGASNGQVLTYESSGNQWVPSTVSSSTISDATSSSKGIIELAGDLAPGTNGAANPTLASTTNVNSIISSNTTVAGAVQKTNNLSDLSSASSARTNLGLGTASTISSTAGGDLSGTLPSPTVAKLQGTTISTPTGGATSYLNATGTWTTPAGGGSTNATSIDGVTVTGTPSTNQVLTATGATAANWQTPAAASNATSSTPGLVQLAGDLGGTANTPTVTSTHLTSALPITQGGTGSISQNFVDLSSTQNIAGAKNFTGSLTVNNQAIDTSVTYQAAKSASYTLALSDANTIVPFIAGTLCTLTVPLNANVAFPLGTVIYIENTFCTQVNIAEQSGVTLTGERISLPGSAIVMLLKQGTDSWILSSVNNNQRQLSARYYPEDYGLIGGSDDTPAIQGAIDAAAANGGGTVVLKGQGYTLTSSPRTDRGGYSVLALPYTNSGTISFSGVKGLTVIHCSLSSQAYSSAYGVPSVIGGPTPEQNSNNAGYKINWYVSMDGITVSVTNNPTYSGIDLYCCTLADLSDIHVTMGGYGSQPTSVYSFGIRMPGGLNYGKVNLNNILVDGFYFGIVVYQSHTILRQTISNECYVAYGFIAGGDTHATSGIGVQWQECKYGITGYSTSGLVSLASAFYVNFPLMDLEDGVTGQWYSSPIHILDANNMIHGEISYSRTTAGVGGDVGPLTVSGAANLTMHDLNANSVYATPSMSSNWSAVTAIGSVTTLIPLRYKKDRTGLVRLEGTFTKSNAASLSSGEIAFTLPSSFRPSGGLYFTTVTDTGPGVIKYDGQNPGNFIWVSGGTNTSGVGFMTISAIYEGLA